MRSGWPGAVPGDATAGTGAWRAACARAPADAIAAVAAGAEEIHVHARDVDGNESLDAEAVAATVAALRETTDAFISLGTGAWIWAGAERLEALATVDAVATVLGGVAPDVPRLLHGSGPTAWDLVAEAARRGHDTRIGLEGTVRMPDGKQAPGNAELVRVALTHYRQAELAV